MGKIRLREGIQAGENGSAPPEPVPLKPIPVAGIVVTKADLIEALRVYVPHGLVDIVSTEDGSHFWLMLDTGARDEHPAAKS